MHKCLHIRNFFCTFALDFLKSRDSTTLNLGEDEDENI